MKFFAFVLVCVFLAVVFYAVISFIRLAFVHIKAYVIRRKLSKKGAIIDKNFETEKKDD